MNRRAIIGILVAAAVVMVSVATQAHERGYTTVAQRNVVQQQYQRGYQDGFNQGRQDRMRGARHDDRSGQYDRRGSNGRSGDQGQNAYRDGYRAGYEAAYRQASNRGVWGGPGSNNRGAGGVPDPNNRGVWGVPGNGRGGYTQVAYDNGYRLGLQAGGEDRSAGKSFDLQRHGTYRDADNGYSSSYGNKEAYRQQFRQGYMQGYQQGYGRRW
jgi:hypothetical protein